MDFRQLLREHNVECAPEGHRHGRPGWTNFDCPYCGKGTKKYHMGYNTSWKTLSCWRCGPHKVIQVLVDLTGLPKNACYKLWEGLPGEREHVVRVQGRLTLPKGLGQLLRPHSRYLQGRGFDVEEIERLWKIQAIGIAAKLQWRIFIPFHFHGEIVSWTTRSISDTGLRYAAAPAEHESMPAKQLLYGEDFAGHSVVVHEGHLDVWATGPGSVGTGGIGYTTPQLLRLTKYAKRYICFDSEVEAQRRAQRLINELSPFKGQTFNIVLDAKDSASATEEERTLLRKLLQ